MRRQTIAIATLARPTPTFARSISILDFAKRRTLSEPSKTTSTESWAVEIKPVKKKSIKDRSTKDQSAKAQAAETQAIVKESSETQSIEAQQIKTQSIENRPAQARPAKVESAKGKPTEYKSTRTGRTEKPRNQPPYRSKYGPRWIQQLIDRVEALKLTNQRRAGEFPGRQRLQLKRLNGTIDRVWSRIYAAREGFLTVKDGMSTLTNQEVAWGDMDRMVSYVPSMTMQPTDGHVNNVVYNKYAETSRVNWITGLSKYNKGNSPQQALQYHQLMTPDGTGLILRSIQTDYKFPVTHPDQISVYHKILEPPTLDSDHIRLEAIIMSETHRRVAARCYEDIVIYDYKRAEKTTLKEYQVKDLANIYRSQQDNVKIADKEIDDFMKKISNIEAAAETALAESDKRSRAAYLASSSAAPSEAFQRSAAEPATHFDYVEDAIDQALRGSDEEPSEVNREPFKVNKERSEDSASQSSKGST
ncbi:hypothetical protein ACHAPT_010533 [Fusarium lateritium]